MDINPVSSFIIFWWQKNSRPYERDWTWCKEFNDAKTNVKNEIEAGMAEKDRKEKDAEMELKIARGKRSTS